MFSLVQLVTFLLHLSSSKINPCAPPQTNYLQTWRARISPLTISSVGLVVTISGLSEQTAELCFLLTACDVLVFITSAVSIFTLIIVAVERYNALIHPFNDRRRLTETKVRRAMVLTWLSCVVLYSPLFSYFEYDGEAGKCQTFISIQFLLSHKDQFIVEGIVLGLIFFVMFYCYFHILKGIYITKTVCSVEVAFSTRADLMAKKKLAMMSFSATTAFFLAYLPYLGFQLYLLSTDEQEIMQNYETLTAGFMTVSFCFQANSFLNPFLYALQSSNYREAMRSSRLKDLEAGRLSLPEAINRSLPGLSMWTGLRCRGFPTE